MGIAILVAYVVTGLVGPVPNTLWLDEMARLIGNLYLSMAARKLVTPGLSPRYTLLVAGMYSSPRNRAVLTVILCKYLSAGENSLTRYDTLIAYYFSYLSTG